MSVLITSTNLPVPERSLAISAHPDDSEFGCGSTLAKWSKQGCVANLIVCTDGSKGSWDIDLKPSDLVPTRKVEQQAAADKLGLSGEVIFLDVEDGELAQTREIRDRIASEIRRLKPNVVLSHDPWKPYRLHPDHRNCGQLVCDALVVARDPHYLKDSAHEFHRPDWLLLFEAGDPNHLEDTSDFSKAKLEALWAHKSQWESTMGVSDPSSGEGKKAIEDFETKIMEEMIGFATFPRAEGEPKIQQGFELAEAFRKISV